LISIGWLEPFSDISPLPLLSRHFAFVFHVTYFCHFFSRFFIAMKSLLRFDFVYFCFVISLRYCPDFLLCHIYYIFIFHFIFHAMRHFYGRLPPRRRGVLVACQEA